MKAIFIRRTSGCDIWQIIGNGQNFYSYWNFGYTTQEIEDYYNN